MVSAVSSKTSTEAGVSVQKELVHVRGRLQQTKDV